MAEFASAVVGLAAVGAKVGDSPYSLIDTVNDAPNEFLSLSNEVTDFRMMLLRVGESLDSRILAGGARSPSTFHVELQRVIEGGEWIVRQIERLVRKAAKHRTDPEQGFQVDRLKWLRCVKKAKKLRDELRGQKSTLCYFLTLGVMQSSSQSGLQVSDLQIGLQTINDGQIKMMEKQDQLDFRLATHSSRITQPKPHSSKAGNDSYKNSLQSADDLPGYYSVFPTPKFEDSASQRDPPKYKQPWSRHVARRSLSCFDDCFCRCHQRSVIRSPAHLADYLGDLFLSCSNLPWAFSGLIPCSEQTCRRSKAFAADMKYYIPLWLSASLPKIRVSFDLKCFPLNVSIQTRNTIPYDSPVLVCAQTGDIMGMRELFKTGTASFCDVDPYGLGLLYYASYYCWRDSGRDTAIRTCEFLLEAGANADWQDEIGNTPMETMVDDTLISMAMERRSYDGKELPAFQQIAQLFGKSTPDLLGDFVEDRQFTPLHKVLLGLSGTDVDLELFLESLAKRNELQDMIDVPDSCGRTCIAWAVEYGWPDAVETLLKYGSDPHQLRYSLSGKTPLLHLVIAGPGAQSSNSGYHDVVRLLLQAGVDVNAVDHEGWNPLHVAASWNHYAIIKDLMVFGAGKLQWDALTDDHQSAVELSLGAGYDDQVMDLLQNWSSYVAREVVELSDSEGSSLEKNAESTSSEDTDSSDVEYFDAVQ